MVRWTWLLAALAAAATLFARHFEQVAQHVLLLRWWQILICLGTLVIGKLLLAYVAGLAVAAQGRQFPFAMLFSYVSITQLAKYIPGGVWQFLGRGSLYAAQGMDVRMIGRALLLENAWQWLAALLIGVVLMMPRYADVMGVSIGEPILAAGAIVMAALAWWLISNWCYRRLTPGDRSESQPTWRVLAMQAAAWACFGVGFWALFPLPLPFENAGFAVGAFAIAAVAGFATPFAPAGIGVREAVLVAALSSFLTIEQAAICAGLSRVSWVIVELTLAPISQLLAARKLNRRIDRVSP